MQTHTMLTISCTFCQKENKVREEGMRQINICTGCGDLLFELDDEANGIRITKRFRELYCIIEDQLDDLRKMLLKTDKEKIKTMSAEDSASAFEKDQIVPEKNISGMRQIVSHFRNENSISDSDTRQSSSDLAALVEEYLDRYDSFASMFDGKKSASELKEAMRVLREKEKEVNAFTRMLSMYLGTNARH